MPDTRLTYRRRHSYNTTNNRVKKIRTPGGKLVFQYISKRGKGVKCGDCGQLLVGIPQLRPQQLGRVAKRVKTVSRAYGGSRCAGCVRQRVIRAFLIEEQKIVKRVLKAQQQAAKKAAKEQSK